MEHSKIGADDDDAAVRRLLGVHGPSSVDHEWLRPTPSQLALGALQRVSDLNRALDPSDERELQVSWLSLEFACYSTSAEYQQLTLTRAAQSLARVRNAAVRSTVLQQQLAEAADYDLKDLYRIIVDEAETLDVSEGGLFGEPTEDALPPDVEQAHAASDSAGTSSQLAASSGSVSFGTQTDVQMSIATPAGQAECPIDRSRTAPQVISGRRWSRYTAARLLGLFAIVLLCALLMLRPNGDVAVVFNDDPRGDLLQAPVGVNSLGGSDGTWLFIGDPIGVKRGHPNPLRYQWLLHVGRSVQLVACSADERQPLSYKSRVVKHPGDYEYLLIVTSNHPSQQFPLDCTDLADDRRVTLLTSEEMAELMTHPLSQDRCRDILSEALKREFQGTDFRVFVDQYRYQAQKRGQ